VKSGHEYGPDCLRRFLPKIGPVLNAEYNIDISTLKIKDLGNILSKNEESIENLTKTIKETDSFKMIVGGSKGLI